MQDAGADCNAKDAEGNTALHMAATGASPDIILALVQHGASVQAVNTARETPLHVAARHRTVATVTTLVKANADVRTCPSWL